MNLGFNFKGDGIVGLGFSSLSGGHKTLLDNLYLQKKIKEKVNLTIIISVIEILNLLVKEEGGIGINNRWSKQKALRQGF